MTPKPQSRWLHGQWSSKWYALVAILIVAVFQFAGFVYFAHQSAVRTAQVARLQTQLDDTERALASDDLTLANLHRELAQLAREHHVTGDQLRRLARRSRPSMDVVTATPHPAPRTTVTRTSSPAPTHRHRVPSPNPSCTGVQASNQCVPTHVPTIVPTLRLGLRGSR